MLIIGMMSGTSADGIDAVLVDIREERDSLAFKLLDSLSVSYSTELRRSILNLTTSTSLFARDFCLLHAAIGEQYAQTALQLMIQARVTCKEVAAVAMHGQTLWHQPEPTEYAGTTVSGTLQLGDPARVAALTGCYVVSDFRSADIAAGGQGAPLVPFTDWVLFRHPTENRVALNIGGIANVTVIPAGCSQDQVRGWDTGPGNVLIDLAVGAISEGVKTYDEDGAFAKSGTVREGALAWLLDDPYFRQPPPKSTGREKFGEAFVRRALTQFTTLRLSQADSVATLTALTAESIAADIRRSFDTHRVIAAGGGIRNETLMSMLRERMPGTTIDMSDAYRVPSQFREAIAFAVIAHETLHGRPGNLPAVTGASRHAVLGVISHPPYDSTKVW